MNGAEPMIYTMLTVYAVYIVLGVVLGILLARLLIALTHFVKTLNDYWRMRAASQYETGRRE
jgi:hypothetical protein